MGWALAVSAAVVLSCYALSGFQIYHALSHFDLPLAMTRQANNSAAL